MTYGESHIVAYKLYVNGKVEAVLSSDQTTFTWNRGSACEEYVFQVKVDINFLIILSFNKLFQIRL